MTPLTQKLEDKKKEPMKSMKSFWDWQMNEELNKIKDATEELSLLKHWALNFDKMATVHKNEVIRMMNERMRKSDFYDCFADFEEIEDE